MEHINADRLENSAISFDIAASNGFFLGEEPSFFILLELGT
jgi:hypothetical protein